MSVLALASAKGAPGVTTTAVALGAVWPRRVLVAECDPTGGDLAARFRLPPDPSLLSLAVSARRGELAAADVWAHTQRLPNGLDVLTGLRATGQDRALAQLWSLLPTALAALDADVLIDCGRLTTETVADGLAGRADLLVLLARPTLEAVVHLADRLEVLRRIGVDAQVVLVGERPFDRASVRDALAAEQLTATLRGVLSDDPRGAAMLAGQPGSQRWLERASPLIRSARRLAGDLAGGLAGQRTQPAAGAEVGA